MAFKSREQKQIHAYVATPAYDGRVYTDYALSLGQSMQAAALHGINVTAAVMGNGAFIELARNNFVRIFLEETECTHLFFIDADLKWEARAFVELLRAGHKVCAGAYRRRQEPESYPLRWMEHPTLGGLWVENDWVICNRVATGFLCIERSVIEEMAAKAKKQKLGDVPEAPRLFHTKFLDDGRFMGEDYAWCDDYMEQFPGDNIKVWADFDFKHAGFECNFHNYLAESIRKNMEEQKNGVTLADVEQKPLPEKMKVDQTSAVA